jgi:hypothetical protein
MNFKVNPLDWTENPSGGFTIVKQKLKTLTLLKAAPCFSKHVASDHLCHDNAACESLLHIMKVELYYYTYTYPTMKALQGPWKKWIKYYNQTRIRHKLKGRTPI